MSHPRTNNLSEKNRKDRLLHDLNKATDENYRCDESRVAYSVTVSKKVNESEGLENCSTAQKSFISIHSTDLPLQAQPEPSCKPTDCNIEVLSIKEAFPSTSEESLDDDDLVPRRSSKKETGSCSQRTYQPSNSKSATNPERARRDEQAANPEFDIPKNTLCVTGSNPGEPKMCYNDPPKKISKTMRKFLRNIDKHAERCRSGDRDKAASMTRGILKDNSAAECTGDALREADAAVSEHSLFTMDWSSPSYAKHSGVPDKNVTFNTQVIIIHFTGDLCVGQSVETLSKERDQQARNSELRKTFLTKYNEFWPQK